MVNPFTKNTTSYVDFETMSDLQWHCTKCELKSGQAKTWQVWRQEKGVQLDVDENGNFYKKMVCSQCKQKTIHRKLKSVEIVEENKARSGISPKIAKRVKDIYHNEEALFLRKLKDNELEVDHKFPQIRWSGSEGENDRLTDQELKDKFILLTRANNLLKSRYCEKCTKENKRGCFPGIRFWFEGDQEWRGKTKNDSNGCRGCFWNDPYQWRTELNKIVNKK